MTNGSEDPKRKHLYAGLGMVFGSGIGLVPGLVLLDDVALGLLGGAGVGLALGSAPGRTGDQQS